MLSSPALPRTSAGLPAFVAALAEEAVRGAGGSYESFQQRFSRMVDEISVSAAWEPELLELARTHGYVTPEEAEAMRAGLWADGICRHGLSEDCPIGCFHTSA